MIKINEIFFSVQGESSRVGWPTVFVRTSGCHLRCHYCDTKYAYYEGQKMNLTEIIEKVESYGAQHVCLTGGEPLLQKESLDLMTQLCDKGFHVSLETSGDIDCSAVDSRVLKVIDIKTPDSGEEGRFTRKNLELVGRTTEFKFVICSERDLNWSFDFIRSENLAAHTIVFMSPSFEQVSPQWLAEKILASGLPVRLQMQLHKYIWSPETRGV